MSTAERRLNPSIERMFAIEFDTERLRVRQWRFSDREPFAALNADSRVMEFFPSILEREASDAGVVRWQAQIVYRLTRAQWER